MSILYLMEQNTTVSKDGGRLLIKKEGEVSQTVHLFKLEQVVIFGNIFLTPSVICYFLKEGVDTVFMTRNGRYLGRLQSSFGKNILLIREQFRKIENMDFCLKTAKSIVKGKLSNLRIFLMRVNRSRGNIDLDEQILSLRNLISKIDEIDNLDSLRGYEGKGTAIYFEGFSKCFLTEELDLNAA